MSPHDAPSAAHDVLVVGAGPAGLMAALSAARLGARVLVCEQMPRAGLKLLATGGGRCNLTNTLDTDAFMAAFGRSGRFMQPALAAMDAAGLRAFFESLGVATECPDAFHVYPASSKSSDVLRALLRACDSAGVMRREHCAVRTLRVRDGAVSGVETPAGAIPARSVVLACGGRSYPELGATGSGYALASAVGHTIVEPLPVLVSLHARELWPGSCAGVSLPSVRAWIELPRQPKTGRRGDLLFTHRGVSGPVILDLSREVVPLLNDLGEVPIRIALANSIGIGEWRRQGARLIRTLLAQHVPASLAEALLEVAGIPEDTPAAELRREHEDSLAQMLAALPLTVTSAGGFDEAIVTRGGVSLREVNPDTLGSKCVRGLHFAGEILDLDGPCGGFNLTWAFSSGNLAGASAARRA